jgi:hypothetical protein
VGRIQLTWEKKKWLQSSTGFSSLFGCGQNPVNMEKKKKKKKKKKKEA